LKTNTLCFWMSVSPWKICLADLMAILAPLKQCQTRMPAQITTLLLTENRLREMFKISKSIGMLWFNHQFHRMGDHLMLVGDLFLAYQLRRHKLKWDPLLTNRSNHRKIIEQIEIYALNLWETEFKRKIKKSLRRRKFKYHFQQEFSNSRKLCLITILTERI
jgi:hypothetical protein